MVHLMFKKAKQINIQVLLIVEKKTMYIYIYQIPLNKYSHHASVLSFMAGYMPVAIMAVEVVVINSKSETPSFTLLKELLVILSASIILITNLKNSN